jgi:hypothetical protein
LLVLLAYTVSELIYWRLVVPELPHLKRVPLAWWLGAYTPFGLAAVGTGALLASKREILSHAVVAACVPAGAPLVWSLFTGAPFGHDVELHDLVRSPLLLVIALGGFAVMTIIFAVAIALGHAAGLRVHAR